MKAFQHSEPVDAGAVGVAVAPHIIDAFQYQATIGQLGQIFQEDDGSLLKKYFDYGTYTQTGAVDDRHSGLRGKLTLTKYLADEEFDVSVVVNVGIPSANTICAFPAMAGTVVFS